MEERMDVCMVYCLVREYFCFRRFIGWLGLDCYSLTIWYFKGGLWVCMYMFRKLLGVLSSVSWSGRISFCVLSVVSWPTRSSVPSSMGDFILNGLGTTLQEYWRLTVGMFLCAIRRVLIWSPLFCLYFIFLCSTALCVGMVFLSFW